MKTPQSDKNIALKSLANAVSVLLHPIFMPIFSCVFWYMLYPQHFTQFPTKKLNGLWGMMLINTVLFPLVLVLLLRGLGFIKSILMHTSKERMIPLIGTMIFYFWPYLVAKNLEAPLAAKVLLLGNFWGIILLFISNLFAKISMHSSGIGSFIGFVLVLSIIDQSIHHIPALILAVATAIVLWARYYLGAHNAKELWLGLALGIFTQLGALLYLQ